MFRFLRGRATRVVFGFSIIGLMLMLGSGLASAASPSTISPDSTGGGGGYSWTHATGNYSWSYSEPVDECESDPDGGTYCFNEGYDQLQWDGNWQDEWSGNTYEGGTAGLQEVWLAVWMGCNNGDYGYCLGDYILATHTDYTDGTTATGEYGIQTNDIWYNYLSQAGDQIYEGYNINTGIPVLNYLSILGDYHAIVNSSTGPSLDGHLQQDF